MDQVGHRLYSKKSLFFFAPAVFLTRAFMTADNKSNARRKENKDVLY